MKRTKILGFLLIFIAFGLTVAEAQTAKFKSWKITSSTSGGFAGIRKACVLDHLGNLNCDNRDEHNYNKIEDEKIAELGKLIRALKLPGTRLKTVKGARIYDGIYTSFVIALDGREYTVEGSSFDDAKYLRLSKKQREIFDRLKALFKEISEPPTSINNSVN